jgi:glutamyl-tRNA reductase
MPLVMLGISHRTAPPEVRNRHAFPAERVGEALAALADYDAVREAAIVATCNRLEIYADVNDFETGVGALKDFLTTYRRMHVDDFDKYLYTLLGADAVEQLFRVATGLDSMLLGEAEIVAQVKAALAEAQRARSAGPNLSRLFRAALRAGKRARTETAIGRDVVSLGAAAVELASRHCDLRTSTGVVVGAGKMGATVARHLKARGVARIAVANRTFSRARAIGQEIGGTGHPFEHAHDLIAGADLAISAVGRGEFVATAAELREVMARRRDRPLLIVDMGVPRDVEPAASSVEGVTLYELSDLRQIVEEKLGGRRNAIPDVERIVGDHVRDYMAWYQSRAAVPLIAGLRRRAEQIRVAEIEKLFVRYPDLDDDQRSAIAAASVSIINKLLHAPTIKLREAGGLQEVLDFASIEEQIERQFSASLLPPGAGH